MKNNLAFINTKVFDGNGFIKENCVSISEGVIKGIFYGRAPSGFKRVDLKGNILSPGFIDIHTHGAAGIHSMEALSDARLSTISKAFLRTGVTTAVLAVFYDDLFLKRVCAVKKQADGSGSVISGLYLEGPFINPEKRGMINEKYLRCCTRTNDGVLKDVLCSAGTLKIVTMAPELKGVMKAAALVPSKKIRVSFGHSNADYAQTKKALNGPFSHVTHLFNAMKGFHHRNPGPYPAIADSVRTTVEIIADGIHVHPAALKMAYRAIGSKRLVVITDSAPMLGYRDGKYSNKITGGFYVKDKAAYYNDGTLIGSCTTLAEMCRNMKRWTGAGNEEILRMATSNPAAVLRRPDIGIIKTGAKADLTIVDEKLFVKGVYKDGKKYL
jgi:N-acetylglucosamine-6-phosphate deacetylase